jgi:hypothetical protein
VVGVAQRAGGGVCVWREGEEYDERNGGASSTSWISDVRRAGTHAGSRFCKGSFVPTELGHRGVGFVVHLREDEARVALVVGLVAAVVRGGGEEWEMGIHLEATRLTALLVCRASRRKAAEGEGCFVGSKRHVQCGLVSRWLCMRRAKIPLSGLTSKVMLQKKSSFTKSM